MIRFLSAVLTLSAIALVAVLAEGWDSVYRPAGTAAGPEDPAEVAIQSQVLGSADFQLAPQNAFDQFVERPLFSMDRRPYDPPAEEPGDRQPAARKTKRRQQGRVVLTGVIINGDDRLALLREPGGGSVALLRAGGSVEGWELVEINPESVTMNNGSVTEELPLRTFEPPPPVPTKLANAEKKASGEQVVASATETEESAVQPLESSTQSE